jgi:Ca2+-binding RTX toxin-like protein
MAINSTSLTNTPQAGDDTFSFTQQELLSSGLFNSVTNVVVLDVMSNDLGGKAKQLFSIDEGSAGFLNDLLTNNVNTGWETLPSGNRIQIVNGKMQLDISHSLGGGGVESLAAGETITETFVYSIRLANGTLSWAKVTFTVVGENDATTGSATAALATGEEDVTYILYARDLLTGFSDVDGDTLSVSGLTANHGSLNDNGDGTWTFTPDANFHGEVNLTYNVLDGHGSSVAAAQSFTLVAVNDAPMLTGTPAALVAGTEDTAYTVTAENLLAGYTDVDGDMLSVSDLSASDGTVINNGDGTFTITPSANFNGAVTLNYNVIDGNGGSVAASQSYSLTAVNDAPTGAATVALDVGTEDTAYTISADNLLGGFDDVDGDTLSVSDLSASNGTVVNNADGTFTITPSANFNGAVTLNYNVIDGNGGSVAATQSYSLTAVNDAPTGAATAVLVAGTEDAAYTVSAANLLQGFSDVDIATDGQVLSVSDLSASNGAVVNNANGTFTITPSANFNGAVTLNYNVVDGNGGSVAASQSYSLTAVNDAPTGAATAVLVAGTEDNAYTASAADLLQGFSDVDIATNGQVLSVADLSASNGAVVTNADGTFTVTPSANFNGAVTLNYNVIDGNGGSVAASQSYSLGAMNDAPMTAPVTLTAIAEDSGVRVITQAQLLGNASDVDGTSLTATNLAIASGMGSLVSNGNGTWNYTPALNDDSTVSFSYAVTDGSLTAAGSATLDITPVIDVPVFTSNATVGTIREHLINAGLNGFDSTTVGTVSATDAEGNLLNYSIASDSSGGAFKINASTGVVSVRDISLLDYEAGSGLTTDAGGKFYSLSLQVNDGMATTTQSAKIYLSNVTNTTTNGDANYVDGDTGVDNFNLQNGNDVGFGDAGAETISGSNQVDWIFGGAGADALSGGTGNDVLYGGSGVDTLTGGAGADTFVFGDGSLSSVDTIQDFSISDGDKMLLVNDYAGLFTMLGSGTLASTAFASGSGLTNAGSADIRIIYDTNTGNLYYDADGNGSGSSAIQFATVFSSGSNHPALSAGNFLAGPPPGP